MSINKNQKILLIFAICAIIVSTIFHLWDINNDWNEYKEWYKELHPAAEGYSSIIKEKIQKDHYIQIAVYDVTILIITGLLFLIFKENKKINN